MPIPIIELEKASRRSPPVTISKSLNEAQQLAQSTAFLCHSHLDSKLAKGVQTLFAEKGYSLYIDWDDASMPNTPKPETAERIKERIAASDELLIKPKEKPYKKFQLIDLMAIFLRKYGNTFGFLNNIFGYAKFNAF